MKIYQGPEWRWKSMKLTDKQKVYFFYWTIFSFAVIFLMWGILNENAHDQTPTRIGTDAAVSNTDADVYNVYMLKSCLVKLQAVKGGETK